MAPFSDREMCLFPSEQMVRATVSFIWSHGFNDTQNFKGEFSEELFLPTILMK